MELIVIEKNTFEKMQKEFAAFQMEIKNLTDPYKTLNTSNQWLDTQDVCLMLGIGKRTLQSYKDSGLLNYSRIHRKNYFRLSDVTALFENLKKENQPLNPRNDE